MSCHLIRDALASGMRTTVDLPASLLKQLRLEARRRGVSMKELLATALEAGLQAPVAPQVRYRFPTFDLGIREGINIDKISALVTQLEDEETIRKMNLGT